MGRTRPAAGAARNGGFTLLELMITVAVVTLLAAVAYPSYLQHVQRTHRTAAQAQMLALAAREEQMLMATRAYATRTALEAAGFALPSDVSSHYDYAIALGTGTLPTYTITFTPKGRQAPDGSLSIDSSGMRLPAEKWQ